MKSIFITGIGTDVGKTVISAIVTEVLQADYWKPIQAGELEHTDSNKVKALISNNKTTFHEEAYKLSLPMSPHAAAYLEGKNIILEDIVIPKTDNILIIEGAGGLMVPLNESELIIDLIKKLETSVILVSRNYLGSINHTLLSALALKTANIKVLGIIFNGKPNKSTEEIILKHTGYTLIGNIDEATIIDKEMILKYATILKEKLLDVIR